MKKCLFMLLAVALLMSALIIPTGAALPENTVTPLWTNTSHVDRCIVFDEGMGYAEAAVIAKASPKSMVAEVYVYVQSGSDWIYVTEARNSKTGMTIGISCPFEAVSGAYYKAEYRFTITGNGIDEIITTAAYGTYN